MSPEQLEGKEADGRSDIFAFGAVLYEMVTGRKAFEGKSQVRVMERNFSLSLELSGITRSMRSVSIRRAMDCDLGFLSAYLIPNTLTFSIWCDSSHTTSARTASVFSSCNRHPPFPAIRSLR